MRYETIFKQNLLLLQTTLQQRLGLTEYAMHQDATAQLWELSGTSDTLDNKAVSMLRNVKLALNSLDTGTYGICVCCGKPIPLKRLRALPYASRCISCARERDLNIKN